MSRLVRCRYYAVSPEGVKHLQIGCRGSPGTNPPWILRDDVKDAKITKILSKVKNKERILKVAREKQVITKVLIILKVDFSAKILQTRKRME